MAAYYNEHDRYAAEWLHNLIMAGLIPPGEVDQRDIQEVSPDDLRGFAQVHLFAGLGGWPHALKLAGWPDDRPVWTGSCPCQPFSAAGQRKGKADERHLWPEMRRLVAECQPATVVGEQVASRLGREWLAGVRADLEDLGYAVGAADLCAAGVGAPHIRQRLWWAADTHGGEPRDGDLQPGGQHGQQSQDGQPDRLGHAAKDGRRQGRALRRRCDTGEPSHERAGPVHTGEIVGLDDTLSRRHGGPQKEVRARREPAELPGKQFWSDYRIVLCADGKARRVGTGIQPLAHGVPARVGKLRAAGNAIVPQVGAAFVKAFMECRP